VYSGRSRGFAFIDVEDGALEAIAALNDTMVNGRRLLVEEARPRPTRRVG
jgi:RNA recognition motif-containing protein